MINFTKKLNLILVMIRIIKKILLITTILLLYNCEDKCDGDCNGFNFNLPIYQWYLFPSDERELIFYNVNDSSISLQQTFKTISQPRIIEHECLAIFSSNICNESINASYKFNNNRLSIDHIIFESGQDSFDEDLKKTLSSISLNSSININFHFNENQIESEISAEYNFSIIDNLILNNKTWQEDIIEITLTDYFIETHNYNGMTKIWIQKNNGLIGFELEGIIWSKQV